MPSSIYVICDCYNSNEYEGNSFINTILYVKKNICGIKDEINLVIPEDIFERCKSKLTMICDNIFILKLINSEKLSNYKYCELIYEVLKNRKCDFIFTPSGIVGRSICAWLSGKFNAGVTADVLSIEQRGEDIYYKRATAYNNLLASIVCRSTPQIASIQAPAIGIEYSRCNKARQIHLEMKDDSMEQRVERSDFFYEPYDMNNIVIGIGRAVGAEERKKIMDFAEKHCIPIVGTRPLIESGVLPYARQVGQSGRNISCNRYIAIGISGMIQHLVGIINCKEVIAINPDKRAPIHERADVSIYLKAADIF